MTSVEQKFSRSQGRFTWAGRPFQKAPARTPKNKDRFEPPPLPSTPGEFSLYTYPPQETTSDQMVQSLKAASQEMKQSTKQMGRVLKERVNEKVNEMTEDFGMGTEIEARRRLTTSVVRPRGSADKRMLRLSFMYQNQVGINQWLDDDKLSQELKRDAGPRNIRELQRLKTCVNNLAIEYNAFLPPTAKETMYGPDPCPRGLKRKAVPSSALFQDPEVSISDLNRESGWSSDNQVVETQEITNPLMRQMSVATYQEKAETSQMSELAALAASDIESEKDSHKYGRRRLSLSSRRSGSISSLNHKFHLSDLPPTPTFPKGYVKEKKVDSKSEQSTASLTQDSNSSESSFTLTDEETNNSISSLRTQEDKDISRSQRASLHRKSNILTLSSTPSPPTRKPRRPISIEVKGTRNLKASNQLGLDRKNLETLNELLSPLRSGKSFGEPTPKHSNFLEKKLNVLEWKANAEKEIGILEPHHPQTHQLPPTTPRSVPIPTHKASVLKTKVEDHPLGFDPAEEQSQDQDESGSSSSRDSFSTSSLFSEADFSSSENSSHIIEDSKNHRKAGLWKVDLGDEDLSGSSSENERDGVKSSRSSISESSSFRDHPAFMGEDFAF